MEKRKVIVERCEKCPLSSYDGDYKEHTCSYGGSPHNRARRPSTGELVEDIPTNCPLQSRGMEITLKQQ